MLFFALLLALAESTVLVLVDGAASRISRHEVEAGLQAGEAVFQRLLLAQNRQQIERAGELLAADFAKPMDASELLEWVRQSSPDSRLWGARPGEGAGVISANALQFR